jgi:Protein of unknown function (DUF3551)
MKQSLFLLAIFVAAVTSDTAAKAQNYPWCEYLGAGFDGGGRNCGFISFEQCMQSAWGNGGDCRQNTMYEPPPGEHEHTRATPVPSHHARHTTHKNS